MPTQLALHFRTGLNAIHTTLLALPPELADVPWRDGGWTRKQIVGHLLDSAANNRQRFVRAGTEGDGPVSLRFLIEDYLRHQHWHLAQLAEPVAAM